MDEDNKKKGTNPTMEPGQPHWLKNVLDGLARLRLDRARDSKHTGGKRYPRDWHQKKRRARKCQKLARRAQRGKR